VVAADSNDELASRAIGRSRCNQVQLRGIARVRGRVVEKVVEE
jgi:hypothetical protein